MRILHFLQGRCDPDNANGVNKTAYYLSRSQAAAGAAVAMYNLSSQPPIPIEGVDVRTFPRSRTSPFGVPRSLIEAAAAWRPSVVHLHSAYVPPNVAVAAWARQAGIPYVVTPNGVLARSVLKRRWWVKWPYRWCCERPLLQRAAAIHSVGDTDQIRDYGIMRPVIEALNGFDFDSALPVDELNRSRPAQWGDRPVGLFVGRLDTFQKGLDVLLDGLARAVAEAPDLQLVLVGPSYRDSAKFLMKQVTRAGLTNNVVLHGPEYGHRKLELLVAADFFVHPSRWEGLPFAVVEALAYGKPCIVTAAADPAGLVQRSGAGLVVELDAPALGVALAYMSSLPSQTLADMGGGGSKIVRNELQWLDIARRVMAGYEKYCDA